MKIKIFSKGYIVLIAGVLSIYLNSCNFGETGLPRSSGAINEMLIITDSKTQWEGEFGDSLRAFFTRNQVGLPQPEPVFDVINIASKDLGDLFKKFHNIFIAEINPSMTSARFEIQKNVWSDPQSIIKISAPDLQTFQAEFNARKDTISSVMNQLERKRTLILNELSFEPKAAEAILNRFSISLSIPGGFYVAEETSDFMWLRHRITKANQDVELGIMIYSADYADTVVFNPRHIISWRNLITKEHIPGPSEGSFMKVSEEFVPPVFTIFPDFPSGYAMEARGLWEVQNDWMGGAFVSYTFVNPKTSKVITLDGYVYNPNNDKKNFIRHLESIFWAVGF